MSANHIQSLEFPESLESLKLIINNYDINQLRTRLDNGMNPNISGKKGFTLFTFAIILDSYYENYSNGNMTSLFLSHGADINKLSNDELPIYYASDSNEKKSLEMIKFLLLNGSKIGTGNKNLVIRILSKEKQHFDILRLLFAHGADMTPMIDKYNLIKNRETKAKFQKIIKEYTPELKHVKLHKSKIPTEAFNPIQYMDENIDEFLQEDPQNKILKYGNMYTAINAKDMITNYLNDDERYKNTFYPCSKTGTSIIPDKETVDLFKPLFPLERVTQASGFLLMYEIINALNSKHQFIEVLVDESTDIIANTSAQMLSLNPMAVSSNHCQPGKLSKLYRLVFVDIDNSALPPEHLCKPGEELNPISGRCRKVCPEGTERNEKGRCVKTANKKTANKKPATQKLATQKTATQKKPRCPNGTRRNKKTGKCE